MKEKSRFLAIIAIAAIIGFGFASCSFFGDTGSNTGGNSGNTGGNTGDNGGGNNGGNSGSPHTYSETWLSNETHHWKECTEDDCETLSAFAKHSASDWTFKTAADCTDSQIDKRNCTVCEAAEETRFNPDHPALDHHAPDGIEPTCTTVGDTGTGICQRQDCGQTVTGTEIPALGHDFNWATYNTSNGHVSCTRIGCSGGLAAIGDTGPAGGIIFYVAPTGFTVQGYGTSGDTGYFATYIAYYLEAAPINQGTLTWCRCSNPYCDVTTGTAIGTGKANTAAIIAVTHPAGGTITASNCAAKACLDYNGGGKNDWFLPSEDELYQMFYARTHLGISSGFFWSSSQSKSTPIGVYATTQFFGGATGASNYKAYSNNVRAIRAF